MLFWNKLDGKIIKNRYEIQNTIGNGGGGKVYLAKDLIENKLVAIKTSNPNQTMSNWKERFNMEAKILSKLNNPYIIKFHDSFEEQGIKMIVMEYVEGISLENKLKKSKSIDQKEALKYTKQLLTALSDVHSHKVYHRDIKTENIHITIEGNVKLLDFGIVQETVDQDLTRQGSVIGTISYMAPEIIKNTYKKANPRTDIYSVGIMLYQLLTSVKPFKADSNLFGAEKNNNLAKKIIHDPLIEPSDIDPSISQEISHFVMKLIEKEPEDRYQNTKEALVDLEKILSGNTIETLQGYYAEETKDFSMKKQIIILITIIVSLLFLVIIGIILFIYF
ncbi:MAG: serine/threonine protein kinase [Mycoplasmataceae bacterium]|nr:serine/threonine protein kinase [Mycoplasmataceae bacterium]